MISRFDDFELDTGACHLLRAGQEIRLEKLPFDLLALLVSRRGELVSREEISSSLWAETFVDSEHGINTAIRKIRNALDDDPANPRYVQTVVRRGYRFTGDVHVDAPAAAPALAVAAVNPPRRWRWWIAALPAALAAASLAAIVSSGAQTSAPPVLHWTPLTKEVHTFSRLASDGKHVFWTEYGEAGESKAGLPLDVAGCHPYQVPLSGGAAMPVPIGFRSASLLDVSADGHMLVNPRENCKDTVIQGPLWDVALDSGVARRAGDLYGQDAAFSPDETQIAVAKGNELWLANRDGGAARRIAVLPALVWTMHWSPDGERLRFSLYDGEQSRFRLWEVHADGTHPQALVQDWRDSSEKLSGVWIDADDFLFSALRGGANDLWLMRESHGWRHPAALRPLFQWRPRDSVERVTAGPLDFEGPATIPGRREIAVIGTHRRGELQRYDAKSRQFVPFVTGPSAGLSAEMADFSRDGQWMAYVSYPEGALWRSRADGSEALQLTHESMRVGMPRISPDRTQIAFTGERPGEPLRTYVIPFDGGTPRPATGTRAMSEVSPTWSPDGQRLLIRSDRKGLGKDSIFQDNELEIVELASGRIAAVPNSGKKFNQRWSPDGKWIVATPNDGARLELFDVAAQRWSVLAEMSGGVPSWSADSKSVFFVHDEAGVYRVPLATRRPELVASLANVPRAMNDVYSEWCGLAPDGSPLILRNADVQQIFSLSFERP